MKSKKSSEAQKAATALKRAARKQPRCSPDPFSTSPEQTLRDVERALQGRQFENIDEANAFLQALTGPGLRASVLEAVLDAVPRTVKEQAQELVYDAMDARTDKQAHKLLRQALALDPDCVDALLGLAEFDCRTPEELIAAFEKAVAAGERSLGTEFFAENKGDFWGLLETRPYMRARFDLAHTLMSRGRNEEAIGHFEAMLELNPNDNQGARDFLLGCYLSAGRVNGATRLLKRYMNDISAVFAWGRTLERFLAGDLPGAKRALREARRGNRFVEEYLTFQRPLPKKDPETYMLGSDEEAIIVLEVLSGAWADNPLAIQWLWEQLGFRPTSATKQQRLF
ncbi:MAG TPA: tetratricopeptide repeat protein [Terriglobales bacterium]